MQAARARSLQNNLEYNLTPEWAEARWTGKCEVCGLSFDLKGKRQALSPSIDKIDPTRGYTQDNCRFVAWAVNRFKGENSENDMWRVAIAMATIPNTDRMD